MQLTVLPWQTSLSFLNLSTQGRGVAEPTRLTSPIGDQLLSCHFDSEALTDTCSVTLHHVVFLVLWNDPASFSIVNKNTVIGNVVEGQKRMVKWYGKEIEGRIIKAGEFRSDSIT